MSKKLVLKVVAYITQRDHLLVFRHTQFPEAGIQVPAGTVEPYEPLAQAVLREAREETGLADLKLLAYLGARDIDLSIYGRDEINRRHFFQIEYTGKPLLRWLHDEIHRSDGSAAPIEFEFFWVKYPEEVPELVAGFGDFLPNLEVHDVS
jgi:8-oxo-dGTP pyrophosphatase MutT (NUDIX family)